MNKRENIIKIAEQCSEHVKMGGIDTRMFIYESEFPKLADAIMEMDEDIVCPFCNDDNFDHEGLKHHLNNYCEVYSKVKSI